MFLIAQSLILILAVLGAYIGTVRSIAKLEVKVDTLSTDHAGLKTKLDGVSRHLSELTGYVKGTRK